LQCVDPLFEAPGFVSHQFRLRDLSGLGQAFDAARNDDSF
jgi:hypothetical protein